MVGDKQGLQRALASINQLTREREEFACSLTVCVFVSAERKKKKREMRRKREA